MTEEQIAKINTQPVEAGDWALISVQPFTSEENLTVIMKNGDQFVVKVTDAQISTHVITADDKDYVITVTYGPEAEIPDGARLTASEIAKGSFEYESYLMQSLEILGFNDNEEVTEEETDEEPWTINVPKARFFDIQILSEGKKIEPKSPVSVEIKYVGKENAYLGAMSVVHFADSGLEIINGTTSNQEDSTAVSFEQDSFSVTGTIINSANLSEDDYYILKEENGRWHALASDGGTVDVTDIYDSASSSVVNYQGAKNITWEVSFADSGTHGGEGWYFIKAKGEDKYISLNGTIVSGNPTSLYAQRTFWANDQGLWIHYYSEENVYNPFSGAWRYREHYHHFLSWSNGRFGATKYHTQREYWNYSDYYGDRYPSEVRFARVTVDSDVVNNNYPNNTYNEAQIQAWLDQAMTDKPLQEVYKQASIYDYDNRIYQIDFSARSGVTAMAADLSMAFVTDISNSMLFPSSLTAINGKTNIDLKSGNLDSLSHNNGEVYFTIADAKASSTVYALYYDNGWKGMDSSYYAKWKAGVISKPNNLEKTIGSSKTFLHGNDNESNNTKYTIYNGNSEWLTGIKHHQIYDMSDNNQYGLQPDGSMTSYNMGNRLYYLESSVASAVNDMQIIAKEYPLGAVYAGLETFAMDVEKTITYLKIGGYDTNMNSASTTYKNNVQSLFDALKDIKGKDGTDQRDALNAVPYIGNGVTLPNGTNKYVILITDGAPNHCTKEEAISSANTLKEAGYTIITVGLSTKDVSVAPEMLWKSASFVDPNVDIYSNDKSKPKYYYYAESGEDLKWILRDVVRKAMGQATVTSTVTDTIDPLFYPVDKDGNPFPQTSVSYIKKDGSKCLSNDPNRAGKVEYKNNNWVVTWDNQDILPGGWNTSLFVKAKEDFLGGNTAPTNTEASLIPESYTTNKGKQNEKIAYFTDAQKIEKTSRPATPYVNVDELKMTSNSNNFIVYLGEEVTPKEEIKKLWDSIVINTVVDQNGMNNNYTIKTNGDMYYDPNRPNKLTQDQNPLNANNDPVTEIPLSNYIPNSDAVINSLLTSLKDGNTQTTVSSEPFDYAPYGQSKMGTITVALTKKVNEEAKASAPDKHETKKVLNPAEEYVLTVEYKPLTGSERKDLLVNAGIVDPEDQGYMHNGDNGAGKELNETDDQVKSTNTHRVIVCAKGLKITKTDFDFSNILTGAKFELYRTARTGEQNQKDLTGVTGKFVKIADLDASTDGFAVKDELPILKENETYYLVETEAPDGYIMLDHPIQVKLEIKKDYYTVDKNERYIREHEGTSSPETTLYSMAERSKLTLADDPAVRRTNNDGTGDLTHAGLDYDIDTILTVFYSISNNPGVELPATGGTGTTLIYLFGIMLTGFAGTALVMRRRRKAA